MGHGRTQRCSEAHRLLGKSDLIGQKGESGLGGGEGRKGRKSPGILISILLFCKKRKRKIGPGVFVFKKDTYMPQKMKRKKAKCTERHLEIVLNGCL